MAADTKAMAVNGDYGATNGQNYDIAEHNYESHTANHSMSVNEYDVTNAASASASSDISKEEVGWYFVEQYYTTLSKTPHKLYLFYTKQSQFVTGVEAEKVSVCVGQKAISEKIKDLDIQDCKVRVTNVDSQGSRGNIVIQVLGEISNKAQPQRKFAQTFILAEQTNGYFVLNDIFRYILDEDEYEPEAGDSQQLTSTTEAGSGYPEPSTTQDSAPLAESAPAGLTNSSDPVAQERDAAVVDRSLEEAAIGGPEETAAPAAAVNGEPSSVSADVVEAEDAPAAAPISTDEQVPTAEAVEAAPAVDTTQEEKPQAPEPTPAVSPPKPVAAQPAAALKPSAPKTWANLVAGNKVVPAVPAATAPAPAPSAPKATPSAPVQAAVPTGPAAHTAPEQNAEMAAPSSSGSEWQTAGNEHRRQQSRVQPQQASADNKRGYIKNVTDVIDDASLSEALSRAAKPSVVDISRIKKCAFVDFDTAADYNKAVAGNPYEVNGLRLIVEERRIRPPGQGPYVPGRGGAMRGGGGPSGGRGAFRGNRGGFRGRGAPQAS